MRALMTLVALMTVGPAVLPALAGADGLPVAVDTSAGVRSADGEYLYTATAERGTTLVEREDSAEGLARTHLEGTYAVPGVALDETTGGLSMDNGTLVLIEPRRSFPRSDTPLVVLDPGTLAVRDRIRLAGDFGFDALSPDGATMYLTEYTDPRDPTSYRVRAYDLVTGRMASEPIVDKSEPNEQMRGYPLTRVTGAGGRWEYTLYDGAGHEPFVHALDTVEGESLCIDLPWVEPRRVYRTDLELVAGGATISVDDRRHGPVAAIDTASGEAVAFGPGESAEADAAEAEPGAVDEGGLGGGALIALATVGAALVAGLLYLATGGHRGSRGPSPRS
ncbi:MAG: hypothetical protein M3Q53_06900 [Actinomycetota bacterium]|nr:hypothetical protein [Actinomycetota bacterium]